MLSTVTIALLAAVSLLVYLFLTWNYDYWRKRGITTAPVKLLLGSFPSMFEHKQSFAEQIDDIYKRYSEHEKFVGVFLMRAPQLLILDPAKIRDILIMHFENFQINYMAKMIDKQKDPLLLRSTYMLHGKEWQNARALLSPGLTKDRIKVAYSLTQAVCWKLCQYIEEASQICGNAGINGKELALRFTTESAADCVLGMKLQSFKNQTPRIIQHLRFSFEDHPAYFFYSVFANLLPYLSKFFTVKFMSDETDRFFFELMQKAFQNRAAHRVDYQDFMHYLMALKEQHDLSDDAWVSHTFAFLIDGLVTTGMAIAHCLFLLARCPEAQQKLRSEVLRNLDDENGELSYDVLNHLPYLDACIYESLRIFPLGSLLQKICTRAHTWTNINGQKASISTGDTVIIPVFSIHRDAKYYPEPEEFKPERFLPENGGIQRYIDMGVFLGFSDGPRVCLGKQFGLIQSKAAIASIVKRFHIRINPRTTNDLKLDPTTFMGRKAGSIWFDFERVY